MKMNGVEYDRVFVNAVHDTNADDPNRDDTYCETCTRDKAHFFSVYGRTKDDGFADALFDFPKEWEAILKARELSKMHNIPWTNETEEETLTDKCQKCGGNLIDKTGYRFTKKCDKCGEEVVEVSYNELKE